MHDVQNKHIRSPIAARSSRRQSRERLHSIVPRRTLRVRTRRALAQDLRFDLLAVARSNN